MCAALGGVSGGFSANVECLLDNSFPLGVRSDEMFELHFIAHGFPFG